GQGAGPAWRSTWIGDAPSREGNPSMPVATLELERPLLPVEPDSNSPTDVPHAVSPDHRGGSEPDSCAGSSRRSGQARSELFERGATETNRASTTTVDERALQASLDRIVADPDPV